MSVQCDIMVVEDDEEQRQLYVHALTYAGYRVVAVGSGEDAVGAALEQAPRLILTDWHLPGIMGDALVTHLKGYLPTTRWVLMSSHHDVAAAARRCGAHAAFSKGDLRQLTALVRGQLTPASVH